MNRPIYLDCNATTPVDGRVAELMMRHMTDDFGNAGSRTHIYGTEAARSVNRAREQIAAVVSDDPASVIFTSGATECNNIVIFGLGTSEVVTRRKHIISTRIEHKAVLEPLEALSKRGFEITLVAPTKGGWVDPDTIAKELRPDTLLVSVMHVNNETGVIQPLDQIAEKMKNHEAYFHTDAAQGFGKDLVPLQNPRIDMISISGHKIFGPKGVGALVLRKRHFKRPPLAPLVFGGGQERGVRPGTVPVELVVGLGLAAQLAVEENKDRKQRCLEFRSRLLAELSDLQVKINGDLQRTVPSTINLSIPGIDSEAAMLAMKDFVAVSNGSACTSAGHEPSHVLQSMGYPTNRVAGAIRWSWSHSTPTPDWDQIRAALRQLQL